ncbi:unnamed protein product [Cyclocybe aegerita]|uniref:Uncharacterized protein n=1 Tax=Cyclocybe aegerita TaxID=1973307 RepID=A0A8S0X644_CYCAE|nr:unnamed protein product [Cyclocybe aegerita]
MLSLLEQGFLAYLLPHSNPFFIHFHTGPIVSELQGSDKHHVEALQRAVDQPGFVIGVAQVEHFVTGRGRHNPFRGGSYYGSKRKCYRGHSQGRQRGGCDMLNFRLGLDDEDEDDEDYDVMAIDKVYESTTALSNFVSLEGRLLLPVTKIPVHLSTLMPDNPFPFDDLEPDKKDFGCIGMIEHRYKHTILLIILEKEKDAICYAAEDIGYALTRLKASTAIPPTSEDRLSASCVSEKSSNGSSLSKEQSISMLDLAVKWKDAEMWKTFVNGCDCMLEALGKEQLLDTLKEFGFSNVSISFQEILDRSHSGQDAINFIRQLPNIDDIPKILDFINIVGFMVFANLMMPKLLKAHANYDFCVAFAKALVESRRVITEHEVAHAATVGEPVAVDMAFWPAPEPKVYGLVTVMHESKVSLPIRAESLHRITKVIELCIITHNLDISTSLLNQLTSMQGSFATKLHHLHLKLIPHLKEFMKTKNVAISVELIVGYLQGFISQ